jgi:hypothetical protein
VNLGGPFFTVKILIGSSNARGLISIPWGVDKDLAHMLWLTTLKHGTKDWLKDPPRTVEEFYG